MTLDDIYEREKWRMETEPNGDVKYLINYKQRINKWGKFLEQFDKKDIILDFGCGSGYAIYQGTKMGLNIRGLDIPQSEIYPQIHKALGIDIIYYNWDILPFDDDVFNVIIFNWSILFDFSHPINLKKRIIELLRISVPGVRWYISPILHANRVRKLINIIDFKLK